MKTRTSRSGIRKHSHSVWSRCVCVCVCVLCVWGRHAHTHTLKGETCSCVTYSHSLGSGLVRQGLIKDIQPGNPGGLLEVGC